MESKDLLKKSVKDLQKLLQEKRENLRSFYFGVTGSKVKNVKEGRTLRRDIAQILTAINGKKDE